VQRLPLGGTFSLLEVWEDQNPRYALESEGHRDDFSFLDFRRKLLEYSRPYNILDCSSRNAQNANHQLKMLWPGFCFHPDMRVQNTSVRTTIFCFNLLLPCEVSLSLEISVSKVSGYKGVSVEGIIEEK
jgi:hypothetical protein